MGLWLRETVTPAKDGIAGSLYNRISRDVYGFTLGYHDSDYHAINNAATAISWQPYNYATPIAGVTGNGLYNGNIANSSLSLSRIDSGATKGYSYAYDQLNRLIKLNQHEVSGSSWSNSNIIEQYKESLAYDANGNILKNLRNGKAAQLDMDKMNYHYYPNSNKLAYVTDSVTASNYTEDIDNQSDTNYIYDKIGNLKSDAAEGLTNVNWTVYGKIKAITKTAGNTNINYSYDVAGNRVVKDVTTDSAAYKQFYVRDAQGNVLAIYEHRDEQLKWNEQHLYGSSRIGVYNFKNVIPDTVTLPSANQYIIDSALIGSRAYELSNHLGNVMTTISNKKLQVKNASDSTVDYHVAEVLNANDYYAFGMQQPGRSYSLGTYRYGFNGKENDNEVKGEGNQQDYGMRIYDPRLGKFLSDDPLSKKYPELSPYQFASNRPIDGIDLDGMEYSPAGQGLTGPRESSSVRLMPMHPSIMQQTNKRIEEEKVAHQQVQIMTKVAYLSRMSTQNQVAAAAQRTHFAQKQHDITRKARLQKEGYNEDGTEQGWAKLASNPHFKGFSDNVAIPIFGMAAGEVGGYFGSKVLQQARALAYGSTAVSASAAARAAQGNGTYAGVDAWRDVTLKEGQFVVGGLPGQSNFYTTINGLNRSGLDKKTLWEGLQVAPHKTKPFRGQVGIYEVTENTPAAFGRTASNPRYGQGGLPQLYIPNLDALKLQQKVKLK